MVSLNVKRSSSNGLFYRQSAYFVDEVRKWSAFHRQIC